MLLSVHLIIAFSAPDQETNKLIVNDTCAVRSTKDSYVRCIGKHWPFFGDVVLSGKNWDFLLTAIFVQYEKDDMFYKSAHKLLRKK